MKLPTRFTTSRAKKPNWSKAMSQDFLGFIVGLYHAQGMRVPAGLQRWDGKDTRTYKIAYEAIKPLPSRKLKAVAK